MKAATLLTLAISMNMVVFLSPSRAEMWSCSFAGFRGKPPMVPPSTQHLLFRVEGDTLVSAGDAEKDRINRYRILENSKTALVAANGGTFDFFEEGQRVTASVVMIEKATGKFVYVIAEVGPMNDHTTGTCKTVSGNRH